MMGGRRAVLRWAWRLFRREWRQQITVLTLLTVAVAVAVLGGAALSAWQMASHTAQHGTGNQVITFFRPEAAPLEANLEAAREHFGEIDVIARRSVAVPGLRGWVELRAQDPNGPFGRPMLALVEGAYPNGPREVAVTGRTAGLFDLRIGSSFPPAGNRTVVGLVENPSDLGDSFVLLPPGELETPDKVTVLTRGSAAQQASFAPPHSGMNMGHGMTEGPDANEVAGLNLLGVTLLTMVVVALVGTAGFQVIAQRRLRQLAMLAATGATEKHLRLVVVANGAVAGIAAAVGGVVLGLTTWSVAAPALEAALSSRLSRIGVLPWWAILACMVITLAAAIAAAWWPARTVARVPVVPALSGRPAGPRSVRGSVAAAVFFSVIGIAYLLLAGDPAGHWINNLLRGVGALGLVIGVLLFSPLVVRAAPAWAGRLPVAVRLALRDLGRQQARSGAALAAVGLTLGIAVATVIMTKANEHADGFGNLSERQLLITETGGRIREVVTVRTPADVERMQAGVDRLASSLGSPTAIALQMAVDPGRKPREGRRPGNSFRPAVLIGDGPRTEKPGPLFVATPELLALFGADPEPGTEVLTARRGEVGLRYLINEEVVGNVERLDVPPLASAPTSLITPDAVRRRGWEPVHAGWLIESASPLTPPQLEEAQNTAGSADLQIEVRDQAGGVAELYAVRAGGLAAGVLLALAVLAMAVGLIRAETAGELRTLTAVGATRDLRRVLSAVTAITLALLGALIGTVGAYVSATTGFVEDRGSLIPVPAAELLLVIVGVPLAAAAAGWLLAVREPRDLGRRPIE